MTQKQLNTEDTEVTKAPNEIRVQDFQNFPPKVWYSNSMLRPMITVTVA